MPLTFSPSPERSVAIVWTQRYDFFARLHENVNTFQITTQFQWQVSICTFTSATDMLNGWCAKQWQPPKASRESQQAFHGHHWIQKTPFMCQIGKWDEDKKEDTKEALCFASHGSALRTTRVVLWNKLRVSSGLWLFLYFTSKGAY